MNKNDFNPERDDFNMSDGEMEKEAKNFLDDILEFGEKSLDALLRKIEDEEEKYQATKLKCGLIGMSGSGKSSLANAIVGEKIFEVGQVETTDEPQEREVDNLIFVDLPGIGTKKWPQETYIEDLQLDTYDFFLLITANRFYENDAFLYHEITNKLNKKCFVIRTKFDQAVEEGRHDNNLTEQEVREKIIQNIKENLHPYMIPKIYLVSAWYPEKYDFKILLNDIEAQLTGIKKDLFISNMIIFSEEILKQKRVIAKKQVLIYAAKSALNGLNPIPILDIAIDLDQLKRMFNKIIKIYGLDEKSIDYQNKLIKAQFVKRISELLAKFTTREAVIKILQKYAGAKSTQTIVKRIPILGQLAGVGLGFYLCRKVGNDMIDECEGIAREILDAKINQLQ